MHLHLKTPRHVLMNNELLTHKCPVADCSCSFTRYHIILGNLKLAYESCLTSSDVITTRQCDTTPEKYEISTNCIDYFGRVIPLARLWVSKRTIDAKHGLCPIALTELRSFLGPCNALEHPMPNFPSVAAPLNNKLHKGQLQTLWD